jgi:hypothetical protein
MNDWISTSEQLPEPFQEVLIIVDGHRGPSWRNNFPLVAYRGVYGEWQEERHPGFAPIQNATVLFWHPITYPSAL